jgi:hypothetical protein
MNREPTPKAETVEALLTTTWALLAEERARREGLHSRASGLTGFAGIILSLVSVAGIEKSAEFADAEKVFVATMYGLGLVLLTGATGIAVLFILMPRVYLSLSPEEVARYPLTESVVEEKMRFQGRTLRGLADIFRSQHERNNTMAAWMGRAYALLAAGLACVAIDAAIIGFSRFF